MHVPGERRRAVALASLVTLAFYAIIEILAEIHGLSISRGCTQLLGQPLLLQVLLLAPIWLGAWLFALAQRELIAQNEGAYGALLAISHTRGMGAPGLLLGAVIAILLASGFLLNVLTVPLFLTGVFAALYCIALGLPNAPASRYTFTPPAMSYYQQQQQNNMSALPGHSPTQQRVIDAGR